MKVLKYPIGSTSIPASAKFLHMGVQGGECFAWFQVGRIMKPATQTTLHEWKVPLPGGCISLPVGAVIVAASLKDYDHSCTVWAVGSPNEKWVSREIQVFGTGQEMPDGFHYRHIHTQLLLDGSVVLHVFEVSAVI